MKHVEGTKVRESLAHQIRVYLCVGISHYQEFTVEKPHLHTWNHEYNFVKYICLRLY